MSGERQELVDAAQDNCNKVPVRGPLSCACDDFIAGANWQLRRDSEKIAGLERENARLREMVEYAATRFSAIKHNTACIGVGLRHVDFNCIHCLASFSEKDALAKLAEMSKK